MAIAKKSHANDHLFPYCTSSDHLYSGNLYWNLIGGKT